MPFGGGAKLPKAPRGCACGRGAACICGRPAKVVGGKIKPVKPRRK